MEKKLVEWQADSTIPEVPNVDWFELQENICQRLIRDSGMSETDAIQFAEDITKQVHDWIVAQAYRRAVQQVQQASQKMVNEDMYKKLDSFADVFKDLYSRR